jgi:dihydropyrimidine dehydrogenase (NAD+) subunit PreA
MIYRAFQCGWGGAVWKTIGEVQGVPHPKVSPRYVALKGGDQHLRGFENIDLGNPRSIDESFRDVKLVKKAFPDRVVIVSIRGEDDRDAWQYLADGAEAAGADLIEVMYSCPHDLAGDNRANLETQAGQIGEITSWVCQATSLPVTVKMSPNVSDMRALASSARRNGASGVVVANTIRCLAGVDFDTLRPLPTVGGLATYGGYSGPAVKPIFLRFVAELAGSSLDIPIAGVGGISSWRDAVEYLLLGASVVQVGTTVMFAGYRIIEHLVDGLRRFMSAHGFRDVQSIVGVSLQYLVEHSMLNRDARVVPSIDLEKCLRCGVCYIACQDGGYQAINFAEDRIPQVTLRDCVGCGLCSEVCPVPGCIHMSPAPGE